MDDPSAFEEDVATVSVQSGLPRSIARSVSTIVLVRDGFEHPVESASTLGSAPGADMRVVAPTVSRMHARLEPRDDGLWIFDLDSTNGTFVDGVRVTGALLENGARVRLGQEELEVRDGRTTEVPLWPTDRFGPLLGRSTVMRELFERLARIAESQATVLVEGETGTGKELVARAIHDASPRASGAFVVVDCGAIPESLFEAELFGHTKGAFTGAERAREGAVEAANGGTLFLDEVGELPISMQPKLLRALESHTIRRVGETQHRSVDVRVVAATHRDLPRMVAAGSFREDLYFRLAVLPVVVPPLRARRDDIALLAERFLGGRALDAATVAELESRAWAGNVRELRSFVERAIALGADEALRMATHPTGSGDLPPVDLDQPFKVLRERWNDHLEREFLRGWLERKGWNVKAVAEAIGLDRTYVHRLMKKHDLAR